MMQELRSSPYDMEKALIRTNAILRGHFELSSGFHSEVYFQCAKLLAIPSEAKSVGAALAELFTGDRVDAVLAPAIGGIVLSFVVAEALDVPGYFAERSSDGFILRRDFHLRRGERILVVEDVLTTGGSAMKVVDLVRSHDAIPVGIGALVNRGNASSPDYPVRALLELSAPLFPKTACPLCAAGVKVDKPGSRNGVNV